MAIKGTRAYVGTRLPAPVLRVIKTMMAEGARVRGFRWGSFRTMKPMVTRPASVGKTIPLWYLQDFVSRRSHVIQGNVLEFGDHGIADGLKQDGTVVSNVPRRQLCDGVTRNSSWLEGLTDSEFDCVVLVEGLECVAAPDAFLRTVWQRVAPGGALLVAAPSLGSVAGSRQLRTLSPAGLAALLATSCLKGDVEVMGYGNRLASISSLAGLGSGDLTADELEYYDVEFPVLACGLVRKAND
jgi:hypothetical protein